MPCDAAFFGKGAGKATIPISGRFPFPPPGGKTGVTGAVGSAASVGESQKIGLDT